MILDLAYNKLEVIDNLDDNKEITDLWLNKNLISEWASVDYLKNLPNLDTIYLIHNPVANDQNYIQWIMDNLPSVTQIDADSIMMIKKRAQIKKNTPTEDERNLNKAQEVLKSVLKKS